MPKFIIIRSGFVVLLKSDLDVQQTYLGAGLLNKSSCLAAALGVTKFIVIVALKRFFNRVGSCFTNRLERLALDKHSSLLRNFINYGR
jgi:hypothetical protein